MTMANHAAAIKQNDAKRLFKAALQAGFPSCKITSYPDGRIEASASIEDSAANPNNANTFDALVKKNVG
jgi:hypothetical protein